MTSAICMVTTVKYISMSFVINNVKCYRSQTVGPERATLSSDEDQEGGGSPEKSGAVPDG